ncbi:MAG: hypothetical protein QMD13_01025 [Candidatus Bathyarchaeia archaeon]|nr:hypothetical protein [Candidatus Bathyarchaeia archaeon]
MKLAMAALMLTFITAITAGFFVYQFMSSLTEKVKTAFPAQSLQLEYVHINNTCLTVYVRSFASVNIQIMEAYINDSIRNLKENIIISPGTVDVVYLYGTYVNGETYTVKIISSLGFPLVFNLKYE